MSEIARAARKARNPNPSPRPACSRISWETELFSRAKSPSVAEEKIARPASAIESTSIRNMRSPERSFILLQKRNGHTNDGADNGDNPVTHRHFIGGPADCLKMVVQGCNTKHFFPVESL